MPRKVCTVALVNLADQQYQLGGGVVFGAGTPYLVKPGGVWTDPATTIHDAPLPRADGIAFGRDYRGGRLLNFDMDLVTPGPAGDLLAVLEQAWQGDDVRMVPGATTTLRFARNGQARRVYGRPRKFAPIRGSAQRGWVPITADFQCVDHLYYDDAESSNTVSIAPASVGGLVIAPFTFPLNTTAVSSAPGVITVGGTAPTWVVLVIFGPIAAPVVEVVGEWRLALNLTLASDQFVGIDPRPWSRGVRLGGVTNVAGTLTPDSPRLSDIKLSPGIHNVVLTGSDGTGTSSFTIAWRNASNSY